jgi:hypothetical protein
MELWIDGWLDYLLDAWRNATVVEYLKLMVGVIVIGCFFSIRSSKVR